MARLGTPILVVAALGVTAEGCASAVIGKLTNRHFGDLMGLAGALVGDDAMARKLVVALTAGCLLMAITCVLKGAIAAVRGERGGVDTMLGGAYGLLAIVATFSVVL